MNQGGEPAHDDYGLPRVDVQVPDDARELDRDVQAYHRELRALRRHERSLRWRAPLRHSGMIVPLIAGCLVLAMVAGMVLTMFSNNVNLDSGLSGQQDRPLTKPSAPAGNGSSGSSVAPSASRNASGGPSALAVKHLPPGNIKVDGRTVNLATVFRAALALIPARCDCIRQIRRLGSQAAGANVDVYLVGRRGSAAEARRLAAGIKGAYVAIDSGNVLRGFASNHLTVVLVDSQRNVTRPALPKDFDLAAALESLQHGP
ncbi:MAG TPA: hypothetical protein VHJ18_19720 [Streptosporangiaceae bacterium]|nr:hypothetical protein [Streptosporangiaceae bacterium]